MPGFYKKKRRNDGPSKNEEKVARSRYAENAERVAGNLGAKFPTVKKLTLEVIFLDARQNELDRKKMSLAPNDSAVFSLACPGRCGRGSLELMPKISESIAMRQAITEASVKCPEILFAGSADTCAVEARCRLELEFLPEQPQAA